MAGEEWRVLEVDGTLGDDLIAFYASEKSGAHTS